MKNACPARRLTTPESPSRFRGFIVSDFHDKYEEKFYQEIIPKIASGEFKLKEHVYDGLESTGKAFQEMLSGKGFGKVVVKLADE